MNVANKAITFDELKARFLHHKKHDGHRRESTIAVCNYRLDLFGEMIGCENINSITPDAVNRAASLLGESTSSAVVNKAIKTCYSAYEYALKNNYVTCNPFEEIRRSI